jgi:hypothetical protein
MTIIKALLILTVVFTSNLASAALLVSIGAPDRIGRNPGMFTFDINISGMNSTNNLLGGVQFDFLYKNDYFDILSVSGGSGLGDYRDSSQTIFEEGTLVSSGSESSKSILGVSLLLNDELKAVQDPLGDDFTLVTLVAMLRSDISYPDTSTGPGTGNINTAIAVRNIVLSDEVGLTLDSNPGFFKGIALVPEPNLITLLGLGFMGLVLTRRYV